MKEYKIHEIENKRILGRNTHDVSKGDLALFWGGAALEVNVKTREVWAYISADYDNLEIWLCVEINGAQISRFILEKGKKWYCLARNLNPEKENLVTLIKETQPLSEDTRHSLVIHEMGLDDQGLFLPIQERKLSIEFIGDSITAGEGLKGAPDEMDWIPSWMSASTTYAIRVAKKMNADWNTMGKSGWGICWGWDYNQESKIPPHYENVCSVLKDPDSLALGAQDKWTFNSGKGSDYVVINLGTNDESGMRAAEDKRGLAKKVISAVRDFLTVIRSHNPNAIILWVWGMLKLEMVPDLIKKGVDEYKAVSGDKKVFTLELESLDDLEKTEEEKGSRCHPGPQTHETAAVRIVDCLCKLSGEK